MNILGFNCFGHDSAASLLQDGRVVFAVEEERLNRKKHYGGFPVRSIEEALKFGNLDLSDIDHVGFYWNPILSYPHMPLYFLRYFDKMVSLWKESREWSMEENLGMIHYLKKMYGLPNELRKHFPTSKKTKFKFYFLEHHDCHAASALFSSPYDEAAIMTVDGGGEWTTSQLCYGKGIDIRKISHVSIPYSLGALYQTISKYLGFQLITGPGKLMGLSAYGNANSPYYQKMKKLIHFTEDGGFKLDLSYFSYHYTRRDKGVSQKFIDEFGPATEKPGNWSQRELDIAAAVQHIVEDAFIHMANTLYRKTKSKNLVLAGGVALNSVANGRLASETPFKNFFIQPAAGDSGTSMGATQYIYHCILKQKRRHPLNDAFLGPGYSESVYADELKKWNLPYVRTQNYAAVAAKLLNRGKILGWFQGRLEFGPRALGNRSIIGNPCLEEMKDVLNARVKFREGFRPFAPIVLEEQCGEFFDHDYPSPYMLLVYNVREKYKGKIPSVTHADGSARVQTVNRKENPEMWELLTAFQKESGVPMLINTSFNIKGEPIVCTPHEAVDSFDRADMDYLVMGNYIVGKKAADLQTADFETNTQATLVS